MKTTDTMIVQAGIGNTPNSIDPEKLYGRLRELYKEGWALFETHILNSSPKETSYSFVLVKYAPEPKAKK